MDYSKFTDEEVVELAQKGDNEAVSYILKNYNGYIKKITHSFFLIGCEPEDLIQEGMIALFDAIKTFNGKSSFKSYVYLCVKNEIISLIRKNNNEKYIALNTSVSINGISEIDFINSFFNSIETENPETKFIKSESLEEFNKLTKEKLTKLEYTILSLYLEGFSYSEIAERLNKNAKSIDNAMQRTKIKIQAIFERK